MPKSQVRWGAVKKFHVGNCDSLEPDDFLKLLDSKATLVASILCESVHLVKLVRERLVRDESELDDMARDVMR